MILVLSDGNDGRCPLLAVIKEFKRRMMILPLNSKQKDERKKNKKG
jgi:hypothetical protein